MFKINASLFRFLRRREKRKLCTAIAKSKLYLQGSCLQNENEMLDVEELDAIENNIKLRKCSNNIKEIRFLLQKITECNNQSQKQTLLEELKRESLKIPNKTHDSVLDYGEIPKVLKVFNSVPSFKYKPKTFSDLTKNLNIARTEHLGNFTGHRSYYFMDLLAQMEDGLIRYTLNKLKQHQFKLISVPDILPADIIEGCGMNTTGERTQVYKLVPSNKCLSGTSEMALAGFYSNKVLNESDLPVKLSAVSRCFRAETSSLQEERGIYRVHQFTKVEMFSLCTENQSDEMLESFKNIEVDIFSELDLPLQLLDMPPSELGNPAYRKYDIEAWMPGRNMWGEISSCSNCTDYQSRRLNITYNKNGSSYYVHTVNGTACAVPRLLIAILENNQTERGTIMIPKVLQPYMNGQKEITKKKILPELKLVKNIDSLS